MATSDKIKKIKNLLGAINPPPFHTPFDDNSAYDYNSNLTQSVFTFGLQSNHSRRTGFEIAAPVGACVKFYAGFKGQLFFAPFEIGGIKIEADSLCLTILPEVALQLRLTLPEEISVPVCLVYLPVDKNKVKTAMFNLLTARGWSKTDITKIVTAFLKGEGSGIHVNHGDFIGESVNSTNTKIRVEFIDSNSHFLNPLYLFWQWHQRAMFKQKNHKIVNFLKLANLSLEIKDHFVVDKKTKFGPICFI